MRLKLVGREARAGIADFGVQGPALPPATHLGASGAAVPLGVVERFLDDPENGQAGLCTQRTARPTDVPLHVEAVLLRSSAQDAEREFEPVPIQLDRHQVSYGAVQSVMTPVQIALDARDHLGRVLPCHSPFNQSGKVKLDGREALLHFVVEIPGNPRPLHLGRHDPRSRHPAKHLALSHAAHSADHQHLSRLIGHRAETDFDRERAAILVHRLKFHTNAHRARCGTAVVHFPVAAVAVPNLWGNQDLDRIADQLFARTAEHRLRLGVCVPQQTVGSDQEHRVRRRAEDRPKVAWASKQLVDEDLLEVQAGDHGAASPSAGGVPVFDPFIILFPGRCDHSDGRGGA